MSWNPEEWERSVSGLSADDVLYGRLRSGSSEYSGLEGRVCLPDLSLPDPDTARPESAIEFYMIIATTRLLLHHDAEAKIPVAHVIGSYKQGLPSVFLDPDPQSYDIATSDFDQIRDAFDSYKQRCPDLPGLRLGSYQWDTVFYAMDVHSHHGADPLGHSSAILGEMYQRLCGCELEQRQKHLHCGSCGGTFERSELPGIYNGHWACGECLWMSSP